MKRQFTLDFQNLAPYEPGSILLSLLAYPESDVSEGTLGAVQRVLCHLVLKARAAEDPNWAIHPQVIKPLYAFVEAKEIDVALRQFKRRLRDRMIAARMGIAYLKEVDSIKTGQTLVLPRSIDRLSLNQLSELVLDDLESEDSGNVETRVWRPSLPVIHLASAIAILIDQVKQQTDRDISFLDFLANPDLARSAVEVANKYQAMFLESERLSLEQDQFIQLVPI